MAVPCPGLVTVNEYDSGRSARGEAVVATPAIATSEVGTGVTGTEIEAESSTGVGSLRLEEATGARTNDPTRSGWRVAVTVWLAPGARLGKNTVLSVP